MANMFKKKTAEKKIMKQTTSAQVLRMMISLHEAQIFAQEVGKLFEKISQNCYMLHMKGQCSAMQEADKISLQDGLNTLRAKLQILQTPSEVQIRIEEIDQETNLWNVRYTGTNCSSQHKLCTELRIETLTCVLNKNAIFILDVQMKNALQCTEAIINFMCEVLEELTHDFNQRVLDQQISLPTCRGIDIILQKCNASLIILPKHVCDGEYSQFEAQFSGWESIVRLPFWCGTRDYEHFLLIMSKCFPTYYRSCFFGDKRDSELAESDEKGDSEFAESDEKRDGELPESDEKDEFARELAKAKEKATAHAKEIDTLKTALAVAREEAGAQTSIAIGLLNPAISNNLRLNEDLAETKHALEEKEKALQLALTEAQKTPAHEHGKASEQALQKANQQIDNLQKLVADANEHCKASEQALHKANQPIVTLQKLVTDANEHSKHCVKVANEHCKASEQALQKANQQIDTLQKQVADATEHDKYSEQDLKKANMLLTDATAHGKSVEKALLKANQRIDTLQEKINASTAYSQRLQSSRDKLAHSLQVSDKSNYRLQSELQDSKKAILNSKHELDEINATLCHERSQQSELEIGCRALREEICMQMKENAVLKKYNEKLQNDLTNAPVERFTELILANHDSKVARELQLQIDGLKSMVDANIIYCYESMAKEADHTCVVCMSAKPDHVFNQCGHMIICDNCVALTQYEECPICRTKGWPIKIYQS